MLRPCAFEVPVCCWSIAAAFAPSVTSPGLVVRSTVLAVPAWKSAWLVSVRQALPAAGVSAKFCVVVWFAFTTTPVIVLLM
jgi:hypothetical protein